MATAPIIVNQPGRRPVIDYLTKDYEGFRQAMLGQIPLLLPNWTDRSESDFGIVLIELFAYVAGFSGYGSANLLTADPAKANKNYKMIFFGSGTEDTAVNSGRTMDQTLTKAGIKHIWSEDPGYGHDYQIWRQYLYRLLQQTFRD